MLLPFLCYVNRCHEDRQSVIVAASGTSIYSFTASNGEFLSSWSHLGTSDGLEESVKELNPLETESIAIEESCSRKRRKLSDVEEGSDSTSTEIVTDNLLPKVPKRKQKRLPIPSIIGLSVVPNGQHLVLVTGEDKCIRVIKIFGDGSFEQISERQMPKRPCSVNFTTGGSTILCADKFGDVYALPLFAPLTREHDATDFESCADTTVTEQKGAVPFVPSATELTVHTKRNQQALRNQQTATTKAAGKKPLGFDHQLLLGHVSLLTDLKYITIPHETSSGMVRRSYILTADRDEHIRISRGLPQAYITEGYCLEHTEFVSKMCIPPWNQHILISGGGDDYLLVWDWVNTAVRQRIELRALVDLFLRNRKRDLQGDGQQAGGNSPETGIAVSGIWAIQTPDGNDGQAGGHIVVTCEGLSALLVYSISSEGFIKHCATLETEGNVVDVAIITSESSLLYSMDNLHASNSIAVVQTTSGRPIIGSYTYSRSSDSWIKDSVMGPTVTAINQWALRRQCHPLDSYNQSSTVKELLYSIERLRKRDQDDD